MTQNKRSYANATKSNGQNQNSKPNGQKANGRGGNANAGKAEKKNPFKRGHFMADDKYLKFIQQGMNPYPAHIVYPKSKMQHGIRIYYAATNPYCYFDMCKKLPGAFPKAVSTTQNIVKGFLDLGFENDEDVMQALNTPCCVGDERIEVQKTRYYKDNSIYLGFEDLPNNLKPDILMAELRAGLQNYGEIVKVGIFNNPLMPSLASNRGYAIIIPNEDTHDRLHLIPRCAQFFSENKIDSEEFYISVENAPPLV